MVDTLRLNLVDFEIKKSCPLTIQPGILDYSTGNVHGDYDLFVDNSGKIIRGSKAYLNDPDKKFFLTIFPTYQVEKNDKNKSTLKVKKFHRIYGPVQSELWDYNFEGEDRPEGIFLQTSVPKILNDSNIDNLNVDEQKQALKSLETILRNYGIKTNIFNSKLSRVDTFTNVRTEFPFHSYSGIFSLFECSRMKSVGYGDESFLWKNKNQELMIYDKILEMKQKDHALKFRNKNIMRFENRLLKKRKIISSLRLENLNDLYNNYSDLKDFHRQEMEKKVFRYSLEEINELTILDLKSSFLKAKKVYGKRWFDTYCKNFGIWVLSRTNSKDDLKNVLIEIEGNYDTKVRMKVSRIIKMIDDSKVFFNVVFNENIQQKSNVELYNELKTKFFKEVA